jgi:hypothetical protein
MCWGWLKRKSAAGHIGCRGFLELSGFLARQLSAFLVLS